MNANTLFEIYENTRKNDFNDLTLGLAQFHADHPNVVSHEEDKAIREFIGRHGEALGEAYKFCDKEHFAKVVALCEAEDAEKE